jgi:hypothetical protein
MSVCRCVDALPQQAYLMGTLAGDCVSAKPPIGVLTSVADCWRHAASGGVRGTGWVAGIGRPGR